MAAVTDRIERDILIHAPVERVWDLISRPEHVGRWFADAGAHIDLRPGGEVSLTWGDHGTVHGRVEEVDPPRRLAYRWLARFDSRDEAGPANSTLIEFSLASEGNATRVMVVESGFDGLAIDAGERDAKLAEHTRGWEAELGDLAKHATVTAPAR